MSKSYMVAMLMCALVLALGVVSNTVKAQQEYAPTAPPMMLAPQQAFDGLLERLKQEADINAEDWVLIASRTRAVFDMQQELAMFEGRPMFGGGPGMPPAPPVALTANGKTKMNRPMPPAPPSMSKEESMLRSVVDDENSSETSIADALQTYRTARAQRTVELRAAQQDLRELINPRQEALLVLTHLLD